MADIIPFRIERQDDGELRITDIEMAERLGYARVRVFRALIVRHLATLRQMGEVRTVRHRNENGGDTYNSFSLTEHQATFIVMKSDMPIATEITVAIVKAFVAFRRSQINPKLYGVVGMELLGFAPRTWQKEYPPEFFMHLHRVAGWTKPDGNKSIPTVAISSTKYRLRVPVWRTRPRRTERGKPSRRRAKGTPASSDAQGQTHAEAAQIHIKTVTGLLGISVSLAMFDDSFNHFFPKPNTQVGFLFGEMPGSAA